MLADRFGVRRVATAAMLWWSLLTAVTGATANFVQMGLVRFAFGLGEGVFPPCAFKTIAVWFPRQERATANAIMMASNPLGLALSPLVAVAIMSLWGWRAAFYVLIIPGLMVSLLFWFFVPGRPADGAVMRDEEPDEGAEPPAGAKTDLARILRQPDLVKYFLILFTFDIANWGFTTFLPTYLVKIRGFSMVRMGVVASLPFFAGTAGYILGGWLSDRYFRTNRRTPIVTAQMAAALLLYLTYTAHSTAMLVTCQTLAGFFLGSFFAAFWAFPMNTIPKKRMGGASGFINMAGQIAAFITPLCIGSLVQAAGGSFAPAFMLLIGSLLVSGALALLLPARVTPLPAAVSP
jgi:MFS family permease